MTAGNSNKGGRRRPYPRPIDYFILSMAAMSSPLATWANNSVGIGHPERLILLGAIPWLIGVGFVHLSMALGARRVTVVGTVFVATLVFMRGAPLLSALGILAGYAVAIVSVSIVGYLISRRKTQGLVQSVLVAVSIALFGGVLGSLYETRTSMGVDVALSNSGEPDVELHETPDIFVVLTDGYAGVITLAEDFGIANSPLSVALRDRGFQVPKSAWSAYASTEFSFSSLLDMSYPVGPGTGVEPLTKSRMYEIIGGKNRLVAELHEAGYRVTMIESGSSGTQCGGYIHRCIPSPFLDEAVFWTVARTLARPLVLDSRGYAFTVGTQSTMAWLRDNAHDISTNGTPDLILAQLMAPHPPLFLNADCDHHYDNELSGLFLVRGGDDVDRRREAYIEQARCVDGFLIELADLVDDGAVMVYVADHGTDSRLQLVTHPADWDTEGVRERLNILMAVRAGEGCSIGDPVLLPNLMRRVLSCLSQDPVPDLEPRMFKSAAISFDGEKSPVIEVGDDLVTSLMMAGVDDPTPENESG